MSGPEYSKAYIRELQRLKQLEKELAAQIEKSKCDQILQDIKKLEKDRKRYGNDPIILDCEHVIEKAKKWIPDSQTLRQLEETVASIKAISLSKCSTTGNSATLLKQFHAFQSQIQKLKNYLHIVKDLREFVMAEGTTAVQENRLEEFLSTNWTDTAEKVDIIPLDLQELYYELLEGLAESADYEKDKQLIDKTIMKVGDTDYKKRQLALRIQAIKVENGSSQNTIEMLTKQNELRGMYALLGWEAKALPTSIDETERAIKEAREALEEKQASKYIAECIHKVFAEKGYALLEDSIVTNVSGQTKKDCFEFGEDSLIHVAMSDKGQMLFEVVGKGTEKGMDAGRASKLESEMRRFCPNYAEIREALRTQYGISLEEEHLCAPDRKYAKAMDVISGTSGRRAKTEKKRYLED